MTKLLKWRVGEEAGGGVPWDQANPPPPGNQPLLEVGQQVTTPKGEATVKSIGLQILTIADNQLQLDVPKVVLEYPIEGGTTLEPTCLCQVTLHDADLNKLFHSELERLWPPVEPAPPQPEQHAEKVERYETETAAAATPNKRDSQRWKEALGVGQGLATPKAIAQTLYRQHKLVATAKAHLAVATTAALLTDEPHKDWYLQAEQVVGAELEQLAVARLGALARADQAAKKR